MTKDDLKLSLALPGEWALKSLLGPTFAELGDDLKRLYAGGRDRIIAAACKKLRDPEDGKKANLRVARDVFWNGAFSDDEICAEYFGGVLAASRSNDGKDDRNIQFVATIKSLSSSQLRLHCFIYTRLNQLLCRSGKHVNVGMGEEIQAQKIYFLSLELESLGVRHDTDFPVLHQHGLLFDYKYTRHVVRGKSLPYSLAGPTTYGVLLFAAAHNRLDEWTIFDRQEFGTFDGINLPQVFAPTLEQLVAQAGRTP